MVTSTAEIIRRSQGRTALPQGYDIRPEYSDMAALAELGSQLIRVGDHPNFSALAPHLQLLNTGEASQNRRAPVTDQDANKIFELLAACYAMQWSDTVELDHPVKSSGGRNPDVIAVLPEGRLGIACKVLHSKAEQTIIDRLVDGLDQIDRGRCDRGFVFISLKNVLDRDQYWPGERDEHGSYTWSAFPGFDEPLSLLKEELDSINASLVEHVGDVDVLHELFVGRKAAPVVVFSAHVMCAVMVNGTPASATLRMPYVITAGEVDRPMRQRLRQLNHVMQAIPED